MILTRLLLHTQSQTLSQNGQPERRRKYSSNLHPVRHPKITMGDLYGRETRCDSPAPVTYLETARSLAKFKQRSHETSLDTHLPSLSKSAGAPRVILFGDSMVERMQTTAASASLEPWPSEAVLNDAILHELNEERHRLGRVALSRISQVFNAGCGGDQIENMLYRLLGSQEGQAGWYERPKLQGLADALSRKEGDVNLWIVHAGTNNLHKKKGLCTGALIALRALLLALLDVSGPRTYILLTGLFYRKDIACIVVDAANARLREVTAEVASIVAPAPTCTGAGSPSRPNTLPRVGFLQTPVEFSPEEHLDDHVHLNSLGYQMWMNSLFSAAANVLELIGLPNH